MLVAFYRDTESRDAKVKIIKFADRVWINEEGDLECLREIYFELLEGTLRRLQILTPFEKISVPEDLTETFIDKQNILNKKDFGDYKLKDKEKKNVFN